MPSLESSETPVLYTGRTMPKGYKVNVAGTVSHPSKTAVKLRCYVF